MVEAVMISIKRSVTRLDPITHDWILDQSGWQIELLGMWLAKFGDAWTSQYPSTWAVAFGRGPTYYFTSKEHRHGA